MDPYLMGLVMEVINEEVNSERFRQLLIETGIELDDQVWTIANHILNRGEEMLSTLGEHKDTVH